MVNKIIDYVTNKIIERSSKTREKYINDTLLMVKNNVNRGNISCTNLAHIIAAENEKSKIILKKLNAPNIAIITAYNDILSAHQPYYNYPEIIKRVILNSGATAQVASGVPAMCDGVTQGQKSMELSLFSRDVIALSSVIGLSHNVFDGILCLGICDKIVPGLLIGALKFAHLPLIFIPSGPMPSGIDNSQKSQTRKLYVENKVTKEQLLDSELSSYHAPGTCTFYGTANSNQMLMEIMGLHIPGSAFVEANSKLRFFLVEYASQHILNIVKQNLNYTPLYKVITEKTIVNAIVGLLATGGSTNHTIHIPAIAKACGININWDDFNLISKAVPLLAKVYPNGDADINKFHRAGGVAFIIDQLLNNGLLHNDVNTVVGIGLEQYTKNPLLSNNILKWEKAENKDNSILTTINEPFSPEGGIKLLTGNLGRSIAKVSSLHNNNLYIKAPVKIFVTQKDIVSSYNQGQLNKDCVIVLCYQGPKANGMPEIHSLTPILSSLQDQGYHIGFVTDGRMSGASGTVPHAIHLTPEGIAGGNIVKIMDGDLIEIDLIKGELNLFVSLDELEKRTPVLQDLSDSNAGLGRELFSNFRKVVTDAESGASSII